MYMREKETLIGETSITLHYGKDDYNTIHDLMGRINSCIAEGYKVIRITGGTSAFTVELRKEKLQKDSIKEDIKEREE